MGKNTHSTEKTLISEYGSLDFNNYANLKTPLADLADINIQLPGASLHVSAIVKKSPIFKGDVLREKSRSSMEIIGYKIEKVEVLESRMISGGSVSEVSSFKLDEAYKLNK